MFQEPTRRYRLGNTETDWVKSERGVRQGCIMQLILFSMYTEELAVKLRTNAGVRVGRDKVCMLLYADDVAVMNESAEKLQSLQDLVDEYGRNFGVKKAR